MFGIEMPTNANILIAIALIVVFVIFSPLLAVI